MKILLVCNTRLPEIAEKEGLPIEKPESWILGHINNLQANSDASIVYMFPLTDSKRKIKGNVGAISYYSYDRKKNICLYSREAENDFYNAFNAEKPDIIHIFGTEFPHTLSAINAAEKLGISDKVVISIQGIISVIAKNHYLAGMSEKDVRACTLRDFLRHDSIASQRKKFEKRGKYEIEAVKKASHVIGRTEWDFACLTEINPEVKYHFCNETLRESFYDGEWSAENCQKHSIFVSQSNYPLKGFHKMLEAMAIIVKKYPDAHLYTTGTDPRELRSFSQRMRKTYYQKYIAKLVKRYGLDKNVTFLGFLNEEQMRDRYLKSNVFVSPSSIENSSNSVGEAMILGVPVISSDVGGIKTLMKHGEDGFLYPFDEPYMLAHYADRMFSDNPLPVMLSQNARKRARDTHNREKNAMDMLEIYSAIVGND
ncbi:MAG: glycosyltransferase [Clostridia bacterium]|nr:glycosyltransferase [Clostridia bacterium]